MSKKKEKTPEMITEIFNQYFESIKAVFSDIVKKEEEKGNDPNNPAISLFFESGFKKLISRPIKFGENYYRIGFCENRIKLFDIDCRMFSYPIANEEEEFFRDFLRDEIKSSEDMADLAQFYMEIFDGVSDSDIKYKTSY